MLKKRVFVSFDYDHDARLRDLLVGQARHPDSPFDLADWSVKEPLTGDWKYKVRLRIRAVDAVCILCGEYTHLASGVTAELQIAREEQIPHFLLQGYTDRPCALPASAEGETLYRWTWQNLKSLVGGGR